jgi:hypothetical protein
MAVSGPIYTLKYDFLPLENSRRKDIDQVIQPIDCISSAPLDTAFLGSSLKIECILNLAEERFGRFPTPCLLGIGNKSSRSRYVWMRNCSLTSTSAHWTVLATLLLGSTRSS